MKKGGVYPTYRVKNGRKIQRGWQLRFGALTRRFKLHELEKAEAILGGLRYKEWEGTYDIRDYLTSRPLGFENLVDRFLEAKRHRKGVKKYEQRLRFGVLAWGNKNVKEIEYADLEDLVNHLRDIKKSEYYIKHIIGAMVTFWNWLEKRGEITKKPLFPEIKAAPKMRRVIKKEQQDKVLTQIFMETWDLNPRVYIACSILAACPKVRPGELIKCKERFYDPEMGRLYIDDPKEGDPKYIVLTRYHQELLAELPKSFPEMYLFRHVRGNGGAKPNGQFGRDYLYNIWKRCAAKVGITKTSLYPGTKHSTVVHWRNERGKSKSECMEGTGHQTNKAFERYYELQDDTLRELYEDGMGKVVSLDKAKNTH